MSEISQSIMATLNYYDIFDYPLTSFEIFKYLIKPNQFFSKSVEYSYIDILDELEKNNDLKTKISCKNGFYFLRNRDILYDIRSNRRKLSAQRWKKIKLILRILSSIPFISAIYLSGSYAMGNIRQESDIDLLIVAKDGYIWLCRFLASIFLFILGQKRHGRKTSGRFCLNHFISGKSENVDCSSLYNAQMYVFLIPVYFKDVLFYESNIWMNKYLFNMPQNKHCNIYSLEAKENYVMKQCKFFVEYFFDKSRLGLFLEECAKLLQVNYIKLHRAKHKGKGRIVLSDKELEFHPNSPEVKILDIFNERMYDLGLNKFSGQKDSGLV